MSPFFTPPRRTTGHIPLYIAGVNTGLAKLAGELCDGFHAHPYHSADYLRSVIQPAIHQGAKSAGRNPADIQISCAVFVITGRDEQETARMRESVRQQISFYASTPTYKSVMHHHGWDDVPEKLSALAARKKWDDMPALITDEMLHTFAISAPPDQLAQKIIERYTGLLDRVTYYDPYLLGEKEDFWAMSTHAFHNQ